MNKKDLSERDICSKYITPALQQSGWDLMDQVREEVTFTAGKIYIKGKNMPGVKKREQIISSIIKKIFLWQL